MPLSDRKYESNARRGHGCSLHSLPVAGGDGRRPACERGRPTGPGRAHVGRVPLWPASNPWGVSKVRLVSLLLGLTLAFLVTASYILTGDNRRLLLAPASYRLKPKDPIDMELLARVIRFKLEYAPRKVPEEKDVVDTDSHLFSVLPRQFLYSTKSPCWFQELPSGLDADPYGRNLFALRSKGFKAVCERLRTGFQQRPRRRDGRPLRLRCLPYFYIIGQPKCGTTDLFHRMLLHPQLRFNTMKEPHWWTRKRFGYIRFKDGFQEIFPVEDYLDLFDLAAHNIQNGLSGNSSGEHRALQLITGEASASTMWDNQAWSYLHGGVEETEPRFLAQDFIHIASPSAKIIIMLRDPVERLYSDYLYFKMANKSAEDFHQKVTESVQLFHSCLTESSLRSCVYNTSLSNTMPVRLNLGLYSVFLLDWLTVFQRDQVLVLRLEDYAANLKATIKRVFDFLRAGPLLAKAEAALTKRPMSNTRRVADRNLGPMLPATRNLLREFHQPFNHKLASVLDNNDFLWSST